MPGADSTDRAEADGSRPPEYSAIRLLNFVLRYWRPLVVFPLLGFAVVATATAVSQDPTYRAQATLTGPRSLDSLAARQAEWAEGPDSAPGEGMPAVSRRGDTIQLSLRADTEEGAVERLEGHLDDLLRAHEQTQRELARRRRKETERHGDRVSGIADSAARHFGQHPDLSYASVRSSALESVRRRQTWQLLLTIRADPSPSATGVRSRLLQRLRDSKGGGAERESRIRPEVLEAEALLQRLISSRRSMREQVLTEARQSELSREYADESLRAARDSLLGRARRGISPGGASVRRLRMDQLRWQLALWRDATGMLSEKDEAEGVSVGREPHLAGVDRRSPVQTGALGLLGAALLGLAWALLRESVRRARAEGAPEYREFRSLTERVRGPWEGRSGGEG